MFVQDFNQYLESQVLQENAVTEVLNAIKTNNYDNFKKLGVNFLKKFKLKNFEDIDKKFKLDRNKVKAKEKEYNKLFKGKVKNDKVKTNLSKMFARIDIATKGSLNKEKLENNVKEYLTEKYNSSMLFRFIVALIVSGVILGIGAINFVTIPSVIIFSSIFMFFAVLFDWPIWFIAF